MAKRKNENSDQLLYQPIEIPIFRPNDDSYIKGDKEKIVAKLEAQAAELWKQRCEHKLLMLFKHFGIKDEKNYKALSFALAVNFVPGFQRKDVPYILAHGDYGAVIPERGPKKGRKTTWPKERLLMLVDDVDAIKQKQHISKDRDALKLLDKKQYSASNKSQGGQAWIETLESCLHKGRAFKREDIKMEQAVADLFKNVEDVKRKILRNSQKKKS